MRINRSATRFIASALATGIGALSVVAGGRVILGIDTPDQIILQWLVIYNVVAGVVSIVVGMAIWLKALPANPLAFAVLFGHAAVLSALIAIYFINGHVEPKSILAMAFRLGVWAGVVTLLRMPS